MLVNNFICKTCDKQLICRWKETIDKFDEESAKHPLGVDITINKCVEYIEEK